MVRIKFRNREFEWWLATTTAGFGAFLNQPASSMDSPAYVLLTEWMPEHLWGFFFLATGLFHMLALAINGHRWWTPYVRSATTALNTLAYLALGLGFFGMDPWSTAVYSYCAMIGSASLICFLRAVADAQRATQFRRETGLKGTNL